MPITVSRCNYDSTWAAATTTPATPALTSSSTVSSLSPCSWTPGAEPHFLHLDRFRVRCWLQYRCRLTLPTKGGFRNGSDWRDDLARHQGRPKFSQSKAYLAALQRRLTCRRAIA
jgi:hypothetical protein